MLLELLDEQGLTGHFDFLYLPCDFHRHANLGYAFVNLIDEASQLHARQGDASVKLFWSAMDDFTGWALPTAKAVGKVSFSGPHQGLLAHIERYRNSPVMHKKLGIAAVPDEYKPMIFANGEAQPFPSATRKIKRPAPAKRR
eukprot:Skav204799  [mRNA]  locus=scaffold763:472564:475174:+ [translate_table: standard]